MVPKPNNLKTLTVPWILQPLTPIQKAAIEFFDLGFNVFPIPRVGMEYGGKKPPYGSFSFLFTTRLDRASLTHLFYRSNLAVICGRLSLNLFVLDCDDSQQFKWVGRELRQRGIFPWVVRTNRGGHYWLLSLEGIVSNFVCSKSGVQVIGNLKYVVVPPSVHPTGLIYQWLTRVGTFPPKVPLESLDFIPGIALVGGIHNWLPPIAQKVLIDEDTTSYTSNSEAELAAAMSLAKAGYSEIEIISIFDEYRPPHFSSKKNSADWLGKYLLPTAFDYCDAKLNIDQINTWAWSRPWPGRTGESDKRVFLALCHRARLDRRKHFRASVREVAEIANLSKNTAERSLRRLIFGGLIQKVGTDGKSGANLYKFIEESIHP